MAKRSQPQRLYFLLSLAATLCFLALAGSAASDAQENQTDQWFDLNEITSRCHSTDLQGGMGYTFPNEFADVYLDGQPAQRSGRIPTGTHNLRVVAKPVQGQQGISVVEEIRFFENDRDKPHIDGQTGKPQVWMPNMTDANVTFDLEEPTRVRITIERCYSASTGQKEVAVATVSEDCKEFNWEGSSIIVSTPNLAQTGIPLTKYGLAKEKTELKPGTYLLSAKLPNPNEGPLPEPLPEDVYPKATKVEVYRAFPKLQLIATYPADKEGVAKVTLDESLWKDNSTPYLKVYVEHACDLNYATVEEFNGYVEIGSQPASVGMTLFKTSVIKTGPNSWVRLRGVGYTIKLSGYWNASAVLSTEGRKFIEASIKKGESGQIEVRRVSKEKPPASQTGVIVNTPTLKAADKQTAYTVSYDDQTNTTTVGVEEGEVEVTPTNSSLQPFTLAANQQVQVTENNVGSITAYTPQGGGKTGRALLYVGIGVVGLLALLGLFVFFRRQHRLAARPAFYPAAPNPAGWNAPAANVAPPIVNQSSQRCQNPQCGKEVPAGKKFCAHCGAPLGA